MRARVAFAGLALSIGTLVPVAGAPGVACAAEQPRAVLVVDTGARDLSYCVALDDDTVSGIELIVLAGRQHGLPYRLGYGGAAVCMLAGVGVGGDDCFEEYPSFWGYWRGNGSGGWAWSGSGAASTSVSDGDVEGWSWGSGDDGDSHPAPPSTSFSDVCEPLPKPKPTKKVEHQGPDDVASVEPPAASPSPVSPASVPASDPRTRPKRTPERQSRSRAGARVAEVRDEDALRPAPEPSAVAADPTSAKGPPAAGLGALAAAAVLAAAGALVLVRRRGTR